MDLSFDDDENVNIANKICLITICCNKSNVVAKYVLKQSIQYAKRGILKKYQTSPTTGKAIMKHIAEDVKALSFVYYWLSKMNGTTCTNGQAWREGKVMINDFPAAIVRFHIQNKQTYNWQMQ